MSRALRQKAGAIDLTIIVGSPTEDALDGVEHDAPQVDVDALQAPDEETDKALDLAPEATLLEDDPSAPDMPNTEATEDIDSLLGPELMKGNALGEDSIAAKAMKKKKGAI